MGTVPGLSETKLKDKMRDSLARTMPNRHSLNSRRSMLLYGFLGILCFVRTIESAPLTESNESTKLQPTGTLASGLQSKKGQEEEVGNPSEIAYQAWLLIDGHPDSQPLGGLDSASLLRRIKPKSIFVAPNLTACPEGYQDDTMNRCVKDVNIDHQAHKGFIVQRLQAIFGPKSHAAASSLSSSSSSVPSGPLQLNIPFIMSAPVKPAEEMINLQAHNSEKATSTTDSSIIVSEDSSNKEKADDRHEDAIVTVYELNEDESTFFLGNKSSENSQENDKSSSTEPDLVVPVADSTTNLSSVVDNKTPATIDKMHNLTTSVGDSIHEGHEVAYEETSTRVEEHGKEVNISPTLVLLLSPTKVPSIPVSSSDLIVTHNSSLGQVVIKMENVTGNATEEIIRVSVPEPIASSSSTKINLDFDVNSTEDSRTGVDFTSGEDGAIEATEATEAYYDENYEDSTETEDEILKHSEAGMTVTLPTPGKRVTVKSATVYSDKQPTGNSEISSEVIINGDFVRETTLVDFNVSKLPNSTSSSLTDDSERLGEAAKDMEDVETDLGSSFDDLRNDKRYGHISKAEDTQSNDSYVKKLTPYDTSNGNDTSQRKMPIVVLPSRPIEEELEEMIRNGATSTEKTDNTETMIASSTNDAGTFVFRDKPKFDIPPFSSSKKRAGQPFRYEATTKIPQKLFATVPNVDGVYDYEPREHPHRNPYGVPEDDGLPVIRTIDEQRYRPDTEEEDKHFFDAQQPHDYVRFPSYDRHGRPNYVRFPSEEANSIHRNEYKERRPYNRYQQQYDYERDSPATKNPSGQDIHQKQSYWWLPPGWRVDKQQQEAHQRSRSGTDQSRTPMLLRFWTRMPLARDPNLNYQHPTYPTPGARDSGSARRVNYYKEMSTQDLNRAFARKYLPSAIGG